MNVASMTLHEDEQNFDCLLLTHENDYGVNRRN